MKKFYLIPLMIIGAVFTDQQVPGQSPEREPNTVFGSVRWAGYPTMLLSRFST
jgi:hypothetical protein